MNEQEDGTVGKRYPNFDNEMDSDGQQLTGLIIKSKRESKTRSGETFYKFSFADQNNNEFNMNCFKEFGQKFNAGDIVNVFYVVKGNFSNVLSMDHVDGQQTELSPNINTIDMTGNVNEQPVHKEPVPEQPARSYNEPTPHNHVDTGQSNHTVVPQYKSGRNNKQINSEFIVNIQGKEFITANGLLALAEQEGGIESIETKRLDINYEHSAAFAIVRVTMGDGRVFENAGSATPENLKNNMVKNFAEMAVSRAMARAIRFGLNVDYCSSEEIGDI